MAGTYTEVAQQDDDRNDGASPVSLSPALSPSPMPLLQAVKSTFTPISMDCDDSYQQLDSEDHIIGEFPPNDNDSDQRADKTSQTAIGNSDAVDLAQSVGARASARATALQCPTPNNTEPDLHSASSGAVDTASSGRSSPISNLVNTRSHVSQGTNAASPTAVHRISSSSSSNSPKATIGHLADLGCTSSAKSSTSVEDNNDILQQQHSQQQQSPLLVKPKPLIRTASTKGVKIIHPSPTVRSRSSSHASNIAQLEATAEKLSRTSSIESAIRDLHEEQKRSDSRRSSILQASAGFGPDYKEPFPFTRQVSVASSILDTNNAARHGGYSPAGYVMSPNHSLLSNHSRLRSASHPHSEADSSDLLTRHGPGKSSTRSAKSTKPSLTDIAEMEPTGLTLAAMDEADRLQEHPEEHHSSHMPPMDDVDLTPGAASHNGPGATDYWGNSHAGGQVEQGRHDERPRSRAESVGTIDQAKDAFADFDGAHCSPEADEDPFQAPFNLDLSLQMPIDQPREPGRPIISAPMNPTVRPKSYLDPMTGQQMMFYPARVPMMLNLPQKLSKNPKAAVRNQRRSQVLSMMPEATRQSAAWLPEVVPEPMFDPLGPGSGSNSEIPTPLVEAEPAPEAEGPLLSAEDDSAPQARPNLRSVDSEARKSRLSVMDPSDKRKSRMSYTIDNLPPQLRASAFFDMPSESPNIELKDGSAMATLDSILDASAKAPVSAFTDHSFAGKLGDETYGVEKRKSHVKRNSTADALEVKKRRSIFHLRAPSKISIRSSSKEEKQSNMSSPGLGIKNGSESGDDEHNKLASDAEDGEDVSDNEEDSDIDPVSHGPPTTLLAELQIRKHQQKMRTKAPGLLYPNGMHSTLLEIDTVAEMERQNRKGKKINLAWEGANDAAGESDDEDVPLGLLPVKQNGASKMQAFQAEMNRPLGLMEQRNLDDNEPLSHRRNRLQGRPTLASRQSLMALSGGGALGMSGGLGPPSPALRTHTPEEDEHEGETLGERKRRLAAQGDAENPLPQARPVSGAFSAELLGQLGDTFKEDAVSDTKEKDKAAPAEEEETLGQRRRRLQAEREAREKEMGAGGGPLQIPAPPMITKRHSMADVLGATRRTVLTDPRADTERAKQEEAQRFRKSQDLKLAGFRAQIPDNLSTPNLQRSGGYMAGQYNDGTAGGLGRTRLQHSSSFQAPGVQQLPMNNAIGGIMGGNNAYGMGSVGGYNGMHNNGYGQNVLAYNGMPLQLPMPMQQPGQQYDRVDRWRQSIVP
ncbi:hypothetical protein PFICI_09293 [Pestalotiopsis fici W106-1]|uniref:Uncharacterized protein n=1 Tax=Pestalotiopsis fici (strain W106-1 / CGMCC3.15140) TaxID=1229662 RepID=W3X014_PESFW|nr:uncharacterized protein PFICI_09293 [Pestalotiopsis fici W106-1]ETS79440.1 hypothetical protein PFICI_09293 [Pestalotiopsis fici W106-1]